MKQPKNFTLDEDIIKIIKEDSEKQERSESFIVNQILKKYYKKEARK